MTALKAAPVLLAILAAAPASAAPPGPGSATYAEHCAHCHGPEGRPELPGTPDFTLGNGLGKSDPALMEAIRHGLGTMPGFDGAIDNEDLIDVLYYIRALEN